MLQLIMFLFIAKNSDHVDQYFFLKTIKNKKVWITKIAGPIDVENLNNIINVNDWTNEEIQQLINNFHKLGIDVTIEIKENEVFLKLKGPTLIIDKKSDKDPLSVGDNMDKKFSRLEVFNDIRNGYDSFLNKLEIFLFNYSISAGKTINFEQINKDNYRSKIKINEINIPIKFICNDFIDISKEDLKILNQIYYEIHTRNLVREENIFLKLFSNITGDSSHYVSNIGKKDKEAIINILKGMGYINAKFIQKTTIYHMLPNYTADGAGIIYSLVLGKKCKLNQIILQSDSLNKDLNHKIQEILNDHFLNSSKYLYTTEVIDKLIQKLNVKCSKIKIFKLSDQSFNLLVWCDYNNNDKFYQNIRFFNFPCSSSSLYKFASNFGICIGAPVIEKNLNDFNKSLDDITGRKINFNHSFDRGMIVNFTAGPKPPYYKRVETFLRANPIEGLVLSIVQLQFFLINKNLFKVLLVPELSTSISNGLNGILEKLKIGPKLEIDYYTKKNININFVMHGMFKLNEIIKYLKQSPDNITDLDIKLTLKKDDSSVFVSLGQNDSSGLKHLLEQDNNSFVFQNNKSNFSYILINGYDLEHNFQHKEFWNSFNFGFKTYFPIETTSWRVKNLGFNLYSKFHNAFFDFGALCLSQFLCSFTPKANINSLIGNYGEFRIPGYPEVILTKALSFYRFLLVKDFWDSSEIFAKMISAMIGVIAHAGLAYGFNNFFDLGKMKGKIKVLANVGFIIMIDLMGSLTIFFSFTIDIHGNICFDSGIIYNLNPFAKDQIMASMQ